MKIHIYICSYDDIDKGKVDFSLNDHELRSGLWNAGIGALGKVGTANTTKIYYYY
jgi:hypothetical protein